MALVIFKPEEFPHEVSLNADSETCSEAAQWCVDRWGPRHTYLFYIQKEQPDTYLAIWDRPSDREFVFSSPEAAFEFKLRWG